LLRDLENKHRKIAYSHRNIGTIFREIASLPRETELISHCRAALLQDRDTTTRDLPLASRSKRLLPWGIIPALASTETKSRESAPILRGSEPLRGKRDMISVPVPTSERPA